MGCLFCRIAKGEVPAERVYEDTHAVAFLDINPKAPGHAMIIPKAHAATILDLDEREGGNIWTALKKVVLQLEAALKPGGFTIGINHGRVSGQAVDHLHIHVIPRWEHDGGHSIHGVVSNPPKEPLASIAARIREWKKA